MTENSPEVSANTDSFRPILTQTQVEQQMLHNAQEGLPCFTELGNNRRDVQS